MGYQLTIRRAAKLLESGAVSSVDLSSFCHSLAVAGEEIWGLNAFERLVPRERIIDFAKECDDRRRLKQRLSHFDGIPISIKANIAVSRFPITAGSKILGMGDSVPASGYNADVTQRMVNDSGSILIGITSMDEFGMGSLGNTATNKDGTLRITKNPVPFLHKLNETSRIQDESDLVAACKLPHDAILEMHTKAKDLMCDEGDHIFSAGGSSCGSAASVAHGSSLLSLGTDTGGSVRLPSAWCGLVGLKPSYGLLSRHGIVSYASSFDTVGVLGRSVDCSALAYDILAQRGDTSRDSTFSALRNDVNEAVTSGGSYPPIAGMRIGVPAAFSVDGIQPAIKDAWSRAANYLYAQGAEVKELPTTSLSPKLIQRALAAYYVLVSAEASSNLSRYDGFRYCVSSDSLNSSGPFSTLEQRYCATRADGFGTEVVRRILCGTSVLSSDRFHTHYEAAAKLRAALAHQLHQVLMDDFDAILIPTTTALPVRLDSGVVDNTEMLANDIMTVPPSLAGLPVLTVPVSIHEKEYFKAGISLVGARQDELKIIALGRALESINVHQY